MQRNVAHEEESYSSLQPALGNELSNQHLHLRGGIQHRHVSALELSEETPRHFLAWMRGTREVHFRFACTIFRLGLMQTKRGLQRILEPA